ncbi:MAG: hypothetical protein V3573_14410 [Desulfovibrionaceae bacterium]
MQIYYYHRATGEFLGVGKADPSPLEPGAFLIPANATTTPAPMPVNGKVRVWGNGVWTYQNVPVAGQTVDPGYQPSLADLKLVKQAEIRDSADGFLQSLAVEYGAYEKLTWDQQAMEADALALDSDAPAPLVRSIAAARGMDPLELAARIQANRAQWIVLSGCIVGQRLGYQDQLDAATTNEQVAAVVPIYTLP